MVRENPDKSIDALKTVRDAVRWAEQRLRAAGVYCGHGTDNPLDEAAWLVSGALQVPPAELAKHRAETIYTETRARLKELIERRIANRKPAAYLLNEAWFAGLRFYVDERVVVPRSLTGEFIQERFQPWIDPARARRILDLCTGSGCMAIACARAFPSAQIDAADISNDALAVARTNVEHYGLAGRVRLVESDLFSKLAETRYDVIVTNPPYVSGAEMKNLPDEYRHEPALALESGADGLEAISRILRDAADHLAPEGVLIAEVGNANVALQEKFPDLPFVWLSTQSGDDSVFLLTAKQLTQHRSAVRRPR